MTTTGTGSAPVPISPLGWIISAVVAIMLYQVNTLRPWVGGIVLLIALGLVLSRESTFINQVGGVLHG